MLFDSDTLTPSAFLSSYNIISILELPAEILIQIIDYVGSSYFRSDLSRLAVCKHFFVTQKTLRRLLSSIYVESSLLLVKDSAETLDLDLKGFEDWDSIPLSRHDAQAINLNNDLLSLATIVKQSRKLRILCIQATSELHPPLPLLERRDHLFLSTIRAFLSASNLTSLELDLCGTQLIPDQSQEHSRSEGFHVCARIAALTTLRRLQLRMRSICADVLKHQQHSTNLCLNEVLINLRGFLQLKADIEKQAQVLVAQMAAPNRVRILTHVPPIIQMRAFDVLTGRNVTLSEGAEWDDDGEAVRDNVWDEESEISDLTSDDDE
ncbi:hypothetical protein K458DRAFT_463260 [Lentithecium fluviatile CBS 122367]|uniref:F-box domain-containing protein n=1 Tax=Lentithecium fluviatile CBS 122367 TaxID=1168545 RepID=A0A6G1IKH4_9PLEO|nr:hypothetical protein K458DRAFT_463260 [Lentithecium fluviatile CBS 122367]